VPGKDNVVADGLLRVTPLMLRQAPDVEPTLLALPVLSTKEVVDRSEIVNFNKELGKYKK